VTQPDRLKGRGKALTATPVKQYAQERGIPVYQSGDLGAPLIEQLRDLDIELVVVVAFGRILGEDIITLPRYGSLNLHASLLPRHRGPSPIEAAILAGDRQTGITLQVMSPEMDRGDLLATEKIGIEDNCTAEDLLKEVVDVSPHFLVRGVGDFLDGKLLRTPQNENEASYCPMISKEDGRISWAKSAGVIERQIRAYNIWPVASTRLEGKVLRVFNCHATGRTGEHGDGSGHPGQIVAAGRDDGIVVRTGEGFLSITDLQLENKRRMNYRDFLNGHRNLRGTVLGR
jgi:methionyl-tRNA formyltransferase